MQRDLEAHPEDDQQGDEEAEVVVPGQCRGLDSNTQLNEGTGQLRAQGLRPQRVLARRPWPPSPRGPAGKPARKGSDSSGPGYSNRARLGPKRQIACDRIAVGTACSSPGERRTYERSRMQHTHAVTRDERARGRVHAHRAHDGGPHHCHSDRRPDPDVRGRQAAGPRPSSAVERAQRLTAAKVVFSDHGDYTEARWPRLGGDRALDRVRRRRVGIDRIRTRLGRSGQRELHRHGRAVEVGRVLLRLRRRERRRDGCAYAKARAGVHRERAPATGDPRGVATW